MSKAFVAALGLASLSVFGVPMAAQAAALPTSIATLNSAVASDVTTVQYRRAWGGGRRYWGGYGYGPYWGAAAGFAAGALIASAPYYYGYPSYAPAYAPAYYGPSPGAGPIRQCWVTTDDSRGYGYWRAC